MTHVQQSQLTRCGQIVLESADTYTARAEWSGSDLTPALRYVSESDTAVHPHYWPSTVTGLDWGCGKCQALGAIGPCDGCYWKGRAS